MRYADSSDSSDSDSDSESSDEEEEEEPRRRHRRPKKSRRAAEPESETEDGLDDAVEEDEGTRLRNEIATLQLQLQQQQLNAAIGGGSRRKRAAFKRVDQLWDSTIHNYKLTESAEDQVDEFNEYVFTVRRKFDWENKYRNTVVDIKSKPLRDALGEVMKDVKGVSLVEEQPSVDPNMLFLYLEEIKAHYKKTLKAQLKKEKKRKLKKKLSLQIAHCKLLVTYINEDYEETKKTLYPMLKAGNITFELLWALFKPNSLAYTATYGSVDDPRCFKVDYANKESSFIRGEWYCIEGRYLEYDGKHFGLGDFEVHVESFKGPRKITSLTTYPLKYHKDPEGLKKQLVERGKRFVAMQGMNYRFHKGLAFQKKKKAVAKVNINGRVMVDPAIFRRINPNYPISLIKPKDTEDPFNDSESDDCSDCCDSSDEDGPAEGGEGPLNYNESKEERERTRTKVVFDKDDKVHVITVPVDEDGKEIQVEKLDSIETKEGVKTHQFSEEELLIASPVVLGFAFSEKLWLEFSLSGIRDIEWNEGAFSSLVLPAAHKSIVKGMVSSHKFHAAETIDDVVQGKGRGLVFVLHGPPGVGKTLTAEGIAEYLKCPLYAVSAGELGTDSRVLEHELQKIMDIAHSWGAVLLLDEADVFLEKREVHDIHRNALVSIFLRLLEYFQGILFLTTNRVETFDDAFQSRIHMPLRYGELTPKAKKEIWKTFVEKVRVVEGLQVTPFGEKDFDALARNNLNGRQIKNAVRTAQSLAISEQESFSLEHIKRVLEVAEDFDHDLKGGTGYLDAMRSYT
ncbi:P-loop containing nucleoside triphosphate hydrolase protein [Mytilinidion resinicola]|uniref:P-loop containing nucleoside triphosphate hydrolase protein n=1 Tax=Mytilinidion resinicola TaxID=574789 RepID=A0A6A6Z999_9PEZI|nr:P-loop containing nucleoside triphosphate hydrolase protein [Mytilinidion resinicola]KAF2817378.1 P-loop containing nucleoside triphosphate hydrolase protein [Mytilinidion resinicola]